jgi:peptidoglycan biosynthesis protein MviN/MurJ (putative lipid II flippase)
MTEILGNTILVLMPVVLMPIYGLTGVAIGYFLSYACYTIIMMFISFRRSGQWLGRQTLKWFAGAAIVLGLSQWLTVRLDGLYGGLIPSLIVTAGCAWLYFHTMSQDRERPPG